MTKTLLTALALSILPGFAMAAGCNYGAGPKQTTVRTSAAGQLYATATQTCVDRVAS